MNNIKKLRALAGMTTEDLGEAMYVSAHTVRNWEIERTYPHVTDVIKLAEFFGVSTDYILAVDIEKSAYELLLREPQKSRGTI